MHVDLHVYLMRCRVGRTSLGLHQRIDLRVPKQFRNTDTNAIYDTQSQNGKPFLLDYDQTIVCNSTKSQHLL